MSHQNLLEYLQTGRFSDAETACSQWLEIHPLDHRAWHWRGLARLKLVQLDAAITDLRRAIELKSDEPGYHSNLAEALRRQGRHEDGAESARRALSLRADYRSAQINLGCCLLNLQDNEQALEVFQEIEPADAQVFSLRADAQRQAHRSIQAAVLYQKALQLDPDNVHAHTNLGPLLIARGQWGDALAHCQRAVELAPDQALPLINLGRCQFLMDQLEEAMDSYATALEKAPESVQLLVNIAQVWLDTGDPDQAELWLGRALDIDSEDRSALATLALVWIQQERSSEAFQLLQREVDAHPDDFHLRSALAEACWEEGDIAGALEHFRYAAALRPQVAALHASVGRVLASAGRMDEAYAAFEEALHINPRCVAALHGLATSQRGKLDEERVSQLRQVLEDTKLRDGARASAHNALGYYFDGSGEHALAAEHIEQGNRLQWLHKSRRGWDYQPEQYRQIVDRLIQTFTRERLLKLSVLGHPSDQPVFVVGMPRSGTTLTEQVLASHPEVAGVGERHFAARSMAHLPAVMQTSASPLVCLGNADAPSIRACAQWHLHQLELAAGEDRQVSRIVDKMPDNCNQLGWIASVFPKARIIYCRRDPRDIAVSCWMTSFAQIQWACQQEHLACRLIDHYRLMAHWLEVMPERILIQDYEALVDDPETHIRRLLDWLGLDWHPDCLQFHRSGQVVRTASVSQVRQPIYKRSVKRWEAYQHALKPLFSRLTDEGLLAPEHAADLQRH